MPEIKVGPGPLSLLAGPPCPRGPGCVVMVAAEGRPAWHPGKALSELERLRCGPFPILGLPGPATVGPARIRCPCLGLSGSASSDTEGLDTEVTNARPWVRVHVAQIDSKSQSSPVTRGDGRQFFLL